MPSREPRLQSTPERWSVLAPEVRLMRGRPTRAENLLWQELRRNALGANKFRRQHALGPFIVDFYCVPARLVIEVDGPIHRNQVDRDEERQACLEGLGLTVLRFSNDEILNDIQNVLGRISHYVQNESPLSSQGEGVGGEVTPGGVPNALE